VNLDLLQHVPLLLRRRHLVPKLLRNYKRLLLDKKPVLRTVDFAITTGCTCACDHCYAALLVDPSRTPLNLEEKKRVIDETLELGAVAINFVGGDPLCDPDLARLLAHVPPSEAVSVVTTNAALFDEPLLDRLIAAGLGVLAVSLDDPDADAHDAFRHRPGTHARAVAAIRAARERRIECVVNSVITDAKLLDGRAARLADFARSQGAKINLSLPVPAGRWSGRELEHLSPEAETELQRLRGQSHVRWDGQSNYLHVGCSAGVEKLSITAYGDVMPCAAIQISFGNLRERPLRDIWGELLANPRFARVTDRCPLAEDKDFVARYLAPLGQAETVKPLPARDVLGPPES
jgi:MoaA/NifB/PqqE/SkfB family radical SAM enzyme